MPLEQVQGAYTDLFINGSVGGALGASGANPVPRINHNAAYPIEAIVYQDGGKFKVVYPAQMWRMMLYYWDAGIGAFV